MQARVQALHIQASNQTFGMGANTRYTSNYLYLILFRELVENIKNELG